MATLRESDVTIISGGTGCGKSTQVPQHILDEWLDAGSGDEVSVICAQPRRLAAVGLAERVAAERDVRIGAEVGYSIRLESKRSESATRLLFCTTGANTSASSTTAAVRRWIQFVVASGPHLSI